MKRRAPPYARLWATERPSAGLVITMGPQAWDFVKQLPYTAIVMPTDAKPSDFEWPHHKHGALVHETGQADDRNLQDLVYQLLVAGNPYVVCLRHSLRHSDDCRVYFYPEVQRVAA